MAKVRERRWITEEGEERTAWVADYFAPDKTGTKKRHIKTFDRKKDAQAFLDAANYEVRKGIHTPASGSATVKQAAQDWIAFVRGEGRERTTIDHYQEHLDLHILPKLGHLKLASLTTPMVESFRDELLKSDIARLTAKKILRSLKALLKDARRRGNVAQNVAADTTITMGKRDRRKLKVGIDLPSPTEVKSIVTAADGIRSRALILVACFAGLRASEIRGLRWRDVDFRGGYIRVRQRADRYNEIGAPKSEAGERDVPVFSTVLTALREWKLATKGKDDGYVFATGLRKRKDGTVIGGGNIEGHANLVHRLWQPAQIAAGITSPVLDAQGKPVLDEDGAAVVAARYPGLHAGRHFFASWCISRKEDGGLGLSLKEAQERLGHATLAMTADTYGHLFPSIDHGAALAEAEKSLFG